MKFTIASSVVAIHQPDVKNEAFLLADDWNDWFIFRTLYSLSYRDSSGKVKQIGLVKIGQFGLTSGGPELSESFTQLTQGKFFSLGQDDTYYDNLNKLGQDIRNDILNALNDVVKDENLYLLAKEEEVTRRSLMRYISDTTIRFQFRRIVEGGARLSNYEFTYHTAGPKKDRLSLEFKVIAESNPPTNIHVLIGTNGVGKTYLMTGMVRAIIGPSSIKERSGTFEFKQNDVPNGFTNLVYVSFSAFDTQPTYGQSSSVKYWTIGLKKENGQLKSPNELIQEFLMSLKNCNGGEKRERWKKAVATLETDTLFKEKNVSEIFSKRDEKIFENDHPSEANFDDYALSLFTNLSSGHKIILLTITRLVETVEEKSLILMDEPEGHLHPPLLSAFIRALSDLLIYRNGVAIIATHSPVVVQEVPRKCAWKLRRRGLILNADRLEIESFGENVGTLTHEVFGLEVTHAGFHNMLRNAVKENNDSDYESIAQSTFNNELGMEARALLKTLVASKKKR